jgi:hypothetical protein
MTGVGTNPAALVAITTGIAVVLTWLALREGALRPRPQLRRCPSCGQRLRSWTCWNCTDSRDR